MLFAIFIFAAFILQVESSYWVYSYFVDPLYWTDVAMSANGQVIVAVASYNPSTSTYGGLFISKNGGTSWSSGALSSTLQWNTVALDDSGTKIYAAATGSTGVYVSSNQGSSFASYGSFGNIVSLATSGSGVYIAAATSSGGIYYSTNSGSTWSISTGVSLSTISWIAISMSSTGQYVATCAVGYQYRISSNYGSSFGTGYGYCSDIAFSDSGAYILYSSGTTLYLSTNYGSTFQTILISGFSNSQATTYVAMSSSGSKLLALIKIPGGSNYVYISSDTGSTWTNLISTTNSVYGIAVSSSASTYSVGLSLSSVLVGNYTKASSAPSFSPTRIPTESPTKLPTAIPTAPPTARPTFIPTFKPTNPTGQPSRQPSSKPSAQPNAHPSHSPTAQPSSSPSSQPTSQPTSPTAVPSSQPTRQPSRQPTSHPSRQPAAHPTSQPSKQPTSQPSTPTSWPTSSPSAIPTSRPTETPRCPAGYLIRVKPGSEFGFICIPCSPGYTSGSNNTCVPCDVGFYAPINGSSACFPCPLNTYQTYPVAAVCKSCPAGFVTGATASTSKGQCVNPASNFIFGSLALILSVMAVFVYLYAGRLLRIAFYRKKRLAEKCIMICGYAARAADLVGLVSGIVSTIMRRRKDLNSYDELKRRVLKPMAFWFFGAILTFLVVIGVLLYAATHILFNSLVLWRGYRIVLRLPLSFFGQIELLGEMVNKALGINFFQILLYPFAVIANFFGSIDINLSAVQVTCAGSQAPILLLVNLVIVGFVVIIIKSDLQIYWSIALSDVLSKTQTLISSRYFFSRNKGLTLWYASCATILMLIPDPKKCIQYLLGFVSAATFFAAAGHSTVTHNCDTAIAIPIDSILAILTTIFAVVVLAPVVYLMAQVIVPSFKREKMVHLVKTDTDYENNYGGTGLGQMVRNEQYDGKAWYIRWGSKILRFCSILVTIDWFLIKSISAFTSRIFTYNKNFLMEDHVTLIPPPATPSRRQAAAEKDDVRRLASVRKEMEISTVPTVPWFPAWSDFFSEDEDVVTEKTMEKFAWRLHKLEYPSFDLLSRYTYDNIILRAGNNDHVWKRSYIQGMWWTWMKFGYRILSYVPIWQMLTKEGWMIWLRVAKNYIVLFLISVGFWPSFVVDEFRLVNQFKESSGLLSGLRPHDFDETGNNAEGGENAERPSDIEGGEIVLPGSASASKKEPMVVMTSGKAVTSASNLELSGAVVVNPISTAKVVNISAIKKVEKPTDRANVPKGMVIAVGSATPVSTTPTHADNSTMNASAATAAKDEETLMQFRQSEQHREEQTTYFYARNRPDAFSRVSNNSSVRFMSFVSAIAAPRIVLLQLFPVFTAWSILGVELSSCPLLVFSEDMRERLPPLIIWDPVTRARKMLLEDVRRALKEQRKKERQMSSAEADDDSSSVDDGDNSAHSVASILSAASTASSPRNGEEEKKDTASMESSSSRSVRSRSDTLESVAAEPHAHDLPIWKVYSLAGYLFYKQSRLVQFIVIVSQNLVSLGLVFFPKFVHPLILLFVVIMVVVGLILAMYALLLLDKFLFPAEEQLELQQQQRLSSRSSSRSASIDSTSGQTTTHHNPALRTLHSAVVTSPSTSPGSSNSSRTIKSTTSSGSEDDDQNYHSDGGGIALKVLTNPASTSSRPTGRTPSV